MIVLGYTKFVHGLGMIHTSTFALLARKMLLIGSDTETGLPGNTA